MKFKQQGLLVYEREDRFTTLRSVMEGLAMETRCAKNCREADRLMLEAPETLIVVTDSVLADGNWLDVVDLAARSREKANVIVVSPFADVRLYIEVMDHGAFDFITDSFTVPELVHVLRSAISGALLARERSTRLSAPNRQYPHPLPPSHP